MSIKRIKKFEASIASKSLFGLFLLYSFKDIGYTSLKFTAYTYTSIN